MSNSPARSFGTMVAWLLIVSAGLTDGFFITDGGCHHRSPQTHNFGSSSGSGSRDLRCFLSPANTMRAAPTRTGTEIKTEHGTCISGDIIHQGRVARDHKTPPFSATRARTILSATDSDVSDALSQSDSLAKAKESNPNWHICTQENITSSISPFTACVDDTWSSDAYDSALSLYEQLTSEESPLAESDPELHEKIQSSLDVLYQAYRLYGADSVIGSYNGGKDAVVILHLMRAAYAAHLRDAEGDSAYEDMSNGSSVRLKPRVIYFEHQDEFSEVLELLLETVTEFDLNMVAFEEGIEFAIGLKLLVETNYGDLASLPAGNINGEDIPQRPRIRPYPMGFVLGTRSSDPNAGTQGSYAPSSSSFMPPFMRVNPILSWTYGDVWAFLRTFELPYCSLYDDGYTSLGTVKDTLPCPALAKDKAHIRNDKVFKKKGAGNEDYWPAHMLDDWEKERAGRINKKR